MIGYTACIYQSEEDFKRGLLYWSDTFDKESDAEELCEMFERNYPGCYTIVFEDEFEEE